MCISTLVLANLAVEDGCGGGGAPETHMGGVFQNGNVVIDIDVRLPCGVGLEALDAHNWTVPLLLDLL